MQKIDFQNYPDTTTPIDADNLNDLQDNVEEAIDEVQNNLDTVNNYSTDEVDTGKRWINNKPIYRKVIKVDSNIQQNMEINPQLTNLDELVSVQGFMKRTQGEFINLMPNNYTNWEIYLYDFNANHTVVRFSNNQFNSGIEYFTIIYEYTKTTDVVE